MSKLRCDRSQPCSNCSRSKFKSCYYLHPPAQQQSGPAGMAPSRASQSDSVVRVDLSDRVTTPVTQALESPSLAAATADLTDSAGSRDVGERRNRSATTQGTWHASSNLGSVFIGGRSDNDTGVPSQSGEASGTWKPTCGSVEDQHRSSGLEDLKPTDGGKDFVTAMQKSPYPITCIMVKDRYVGQTHWLHSAVLVSIATFSKLNVLPAQGIEITVGG